MKWGVGTPLRTMNALFHRIAYDYFHADLDRLCDHLRGVPWEDMFKLSHSSAAREFCKWV